MVPVGAVKIVIGTRPEAIKLAPVVLALRALHLPVRVCLTGQHPEMATQALTPFGIAADVNLHLMRPGQSLAELTRRAVDAIALRLARRQPSWVIVQGDTTSALAGAIAARQLGIPVAHVEAGLRSFDLSQPYPEELNRTLIARLATLHFAPTPGAEANLRAEGVPGKAIEVTGNTVVDALHRTLSTLPPAPRRARRLVLATLHRRENRETAFPEIIDALATIASRGDVDVLLPRHPGCPPEVYTPLEACPAARLVPPMPYPAFIAALASAHLVITDSGGIQEEASALGIPTLVVRVLTERPEVIDAGTALVVDTAKSGILSAATRLLDDPDAHRSMTNASRRIGDGKAAERIARRLYAELHGVPHPAA
ncbi:non-hydrolyzing UDP-N-acetylglucosamine 2-epimerase [Sphingosinicella microcystinivorans]|uniref:UDP-N-acetylglucosamine 2-epimerase (non-hydrolyzing) n=1 Tax=Sphingosinicella microcystinivorans TaxID=335406 RepID=A0AAD1G0J2_SPHMI|nr:UDP-N-acetylglucosamine 2-epimerase (non-hydrolyzing) [Sphingosinicella microcystinivorans]RKS90892.1 UDP-N-acetylglucosamine 2-epimerase [Sphingosinicella microcystinivorans]BBE33808.1 UDP-N-acetyl glucosamine 2-epimerase [Sphingosinicella microcystinivorans]